jgi:phosphonate transport system substrate-binding protein
MTFVPSGDTAKIAKAGQDIATYLNKANGLHYKVEVGTSEAASIEAMGGNKAQVGFLNTFAIVLAKTKYDIEVALVNQRVYVAIPIDPDKDLGGKITPYYKGQFLTQTTSGIKTYADLKGKTFCFTSASSTSGNIIPRIILKANGIDPDKDLKATFAGGHDKAAIAVYNGDCVAGVTFVDTLTDVSLKLYEKYPDIAKKVTAFAVSDRIPNDGVQYVKGLNPKIKDATTDGLMKMAADPEGVKILKSLYNIDGFEKAGYDKYYKPFEDVLSKAGVKAEDYVTKPK